MAGQRSGTAPDGRRLRLRPMPTAHSATAADRTRRRLRRSSILILALLAATATGCDGGDGSSSAADEDLLGLSSVPLPGTEAEIGALLEALPTTISGFSRTVESGLAVRYGTFTSIVAIPFPVEGGADSLADDLARFEAEPGAVVEASQLDPAAPVLWLTGSFPDPGGAGQVHLAVWGAPDGDWAFNVSAATAQMRDAVVRAFVEAAQAAG